MDKGSGIFVNDGSFMERFKQMQQEKQMKESAKEAKSSNSVTPVALPKPGVILNKRPAAVAKPNPPSASGGKLAFSLKQKSKIVAAPVVLGADDEDVVETETGTGDERAKRQKLGRMDAAQSARQQGDVAPFPPSDAAVRIVADKLASFVSKNGRAFEQVTRQRNPGDTPFKFLYDTSCSDYKYYEYRLLEEEKALAQSNDPPVLKTAISSTAAPRLASSSQNSTLQDGNYQTPASALYWADEGNALSGRTPGQGESSGPPSSDPIAMMEYYVKKAAQEERKRPPKRSKDEMPPPDSLLAPGKKGHHMGDYIPQEELEKFLSTCNDAAAQKAAKEAAERAKIQADNIGHKLLSKMGWKDGEGLGSDKSGRAEPVMAGNVKSNNLGIGAQQPGEVAPEDDIYEQYKKRMMLGYRYRPNPLGNPRKAYY